MKNGYTNESCFSEPSGISSVFDSDKDDVVIYIADCVNNCIRQVYYDEGVVRTVQIKNTTFKVTKKP